MDGKSLPPPPSLSFSLSPHKSQSDELTDHQVLLLPTIFERLNEKTLYVFGGVNIFAIGVVWAFYPESNQRTLEEMNLVFAADSVWIWDAEKHFAKLKEQNPDLVRAAARRGSSGGEAQVGVVGRWSLEGNEKEGARKVSLAAAEPKDL